MVALLPLLLVATATASPLVKRVQGTSIVNLGNNTGATSRYASGFIYGIPDAPNQIPDHFYTDIGFNYARAGGAQVGAPGRGWIWGLSEYKVRFASALSNYRTARKYNADFIFLIHDLWGADGTQNSSAPYPGDNDDWSDWDDYLTYFIADIKASNALDGLLIDIWNEPDLTYFWNAPQAQYIQMWGRTYHRLRKELPTVLLSGPAYAGRPSLTNDWWTNFLGFIKTNASIPDQYAWHMEGFDSDMPTAFGALETLLNTYELPQRQININEYAVYKEECPAGSAWWISQLERVNAHGLRGNWLSGDQLHDFMGSLVSKPNATTSSYVYTEGGYFPNGDYQVYKYYNQQMKGQRVGTSASADMLLDTFAVVGSEKVRVLTGSRISIGTWQITIEDLGAVGLPKSGTLNIHTLGFPFTGGHFGDVDAPNDLGWYGHEYSNNSVTFPVFQTDDSTAWAFEFNI